MKILVTGATGFLGQHLCRHLRLRGHDVKGLSSITDLRNHDALDYVPGKVDQIYHLAVHQQSGDWCLTHSGETWLYNQLINTNVLRWWHLKQPQAKFISIGTSCSYRPDAILREEEYLDGQPHESLLAYATTKRALYVGLQSMAKQYGHKYLCVIPSTLYGPGYRVKEQKQMHFIFDLIRKIVAAKQDGTPVTLWGDGWQKRELVHVDDFCKTLLDLNDRSENDLFNIGAGEEHTIRHFASLVCDAVGYDEDRIEYDTGKYVGARSKFLVIDKLLKVYPEYHQRSLAEGIKETVRWYIAETEAE